MRLPRRLIGGVVLLTVVLTTARASRQSGAGAVLDTVTVGRMPGWVVVDERTNRAFVANSADHTVSVLDARTGAVLHTIALGAEPDVLVTDLPTRRIFVLGDLFHGAGMLDAASGAFLGTIPISTWHLLADERNGHVLLWGIPAGLSTVRVALLDGRNGAWMHTGTPVGTTTWGDGAVDPDTQRAFVAEAGADAVSVVDTTNGHVLRVVPVGQRPVSVAVDSVGHRVFVANNWGDTVTMLDSRTGLVLRTITVGLNPARIAVDARTARVFVVHGRGDPGNNPNAAFAPYVGISTTGTTILDARSGAVLRQIGVGGSPLDDVGMMDAVNVAVDARRNRVFVIDATPDASIRSFSNGSISVLDAHSGQVLRTVPVGRHPIALAVDETTSRLFVVNTNSGCAGVDPWRWIPGNIRRMLPLISRWSMAGCGGPGTVTVIDTSRL